jgi:hypothetical protein
MYYMERGLPERQRTELGGASFQKNNNLTGNKRNY